MCTLSNNSYKWPVNYLWYAYEVFATYRYFLHGFLFPVFSVTPTKMQCEVRTSNRFAMGIYPLQEILTRVEIYYFQINSEAELASRILLKELAKLRSLKIIIQWCKTTWRGNVACMRSWINFVHEIYGRLMSRKRCTNLRETCIDVDCFELRHNDGFVQEFLGQL
jgi:hypothetical protein